MNIPITTADRARSVDSLLRSRGIPYIGAAAMVAVALIAQMALPNSWYAALHLLLLVAVSAASAVGGLGPGLFATTLACLGGWWIDRVAARPDGLTVPEFFWLLMAQGILMSLLGAGLMVTRRRVDRVYAENRKLEQQILEIGEDERQRIGHDLHDGLGQHLTGISLLSASIAQQIEAGTIPQLTQTETVTRLVSEAVRWTRDLARSLSPVTLEQSGFVAAMEELVQTAGQVFSVDCEWDYEGKELVIDRKQSLHLYRIVQEAISNSVKHGKAKRVVVTLTVSDPDQKGVSFLTLLVSDNGSGLSAKTRNNPGLGLRIMQYRARMIGAKLEVARSTSAGGTVISCTCPIERTL